MTNAPQNPKIDAEKDATSVKTENVKPEVPKQKVKQSPVDRIKNLFKKRPPVPEDPSKPGLRTRFHNFFDLETESGRGRAAIANYVAFGIIYIVYKVRQTFFIPKTEDQIDVSKEDEV